MPSAEPPDGTGAAGEPDYRYTLANERTFLAYERTAVGLVAAALVVFHLLGDGWAQVSLGVMLLVAGAIAAAGGYVRFRAVDRAVRSGAPLPRSLAAEALAIAVLVCLLVAALSVLA